MKILMFGWEFPPHISGGLGTASYGLTKGLSNFSDLELIFVVPKLFGDEDAGVAKLVGAGDVKMDFEKRYSNNIFSENSTSLISEKIDLDETYTIDEVFNNVTKIEINSVLTPYLQPDNFEAYLKNIRVFFTWNMVDTSTYH